MLPALQVHKDEAASAGQLQGLTTGFQGTEQALEEEVLDVDRRENATGAAWRRDEEAIQQAFQQAEDKDRAILASTESEIADMEAKADAAGRALLDDADTKAKAYEDENLRSARRDARSVGMPEQEWANTKRDARASRHSRDTQYRDSQRYLIITAPSRHHALPPISQISHNPC